VTALVQAEVAGEELQQSVELAASETKIVRFSPDQFAQLMLAHPRLWWPYQMGEPYLYNGEIPRGNGKEIPIAPASISESAKSPRSLRQGPPLVQSERQARADPRRGLGPDMLLRWFVQESGCRPRVTKHMGLNAIRLEGKIDRKESSDKTDRLGILVMPGWICCDTWEHWIPGRPKRRNRPPLRL